MDMQQLLILKKRSMFKFTLFGQVILLLFFFSLMPDPVSAKNQDTGKTVNIAWLAPTSLQIPLIASQKHFDEEFGVKLKLTRMSRASDAMQALLAKKLDLTFGAFLPAVNAVSKGAKVKCIMVAYYGGYKYALATLKHSGIQNVADLKDRSVAVPGLGAPPELFVRKAMEIAGLPPDSAKLVQQDSNIIAEALSTGQVDAGVIFEPLLTKFMKKQKDIVVLTRGIDIPVINYSPGAYFVRGESIEKENDLLYRTLLALAKAQWYIRKAGPDSHEILSVVAGATHVPEMILKPSAGANIWDPRLKPIQQINIREEMRFFTNIGKLKSVIPVSEIWYGAFLKKAHREHPDLFSDLEPYLNILKKNGIAQDEDFNIESDE